MPSTTTGVTFQAPRVARAAIRPARGEARRRCVLSIWVERAEAVAAVLSVIGRPVRLRRDRPVARPRPCAGDGCAGRRTELQVFGRAVETRAPSQRAGRPSSRPGSRIGAAARPGRERPQERHQLVKVGLGHLERGHAGAQAARCARAPPARRRRARRDRVTMPGPFSPPLPSPPWQRAQASSYQRRPAPGGCAPAWPAPRRTETKATAARRAISSSYSSRATREAAPQLRPQAAAAMATSPAAPRTTATAPKL